ncbi:MAG: Gfo/Idh/MocA family oxidoreductase [Clostridiales bacterium]|jgi:predicted dehydrogenase|nr:Gfo/Idh/MocA family oxidoreductase [Clostridiales bacterium]
MVNILMLSKWHVHAKGYAKTIGEAPDAQITCVWDEDAARGKEWADELGVAFEPDFDKALARKDVDAVVIETATSEHKKVMIAAADAGKHIFTEKAMALTVADCKAISEAVKKSGVKFCISHPHLTNPHIQFCKSAIEKGILGRIHYMRMRTAHDGSSRDWLPKYWYDVEKAGGGAMMDLGCHPMYVAAYLLGKPTRIASMFNTTCAPAPADDNAVSVVEFENKAIAVLETSFVSPFNSNVFELLGTEGAVIYQDGKLKLRTNEYKGGWVVPDKLPDALPAAMRMWLDAITLGTDILFDTERGTALTELLENAYRSHEQQKIVAI